MNCILCSQGLSPPWKTFYTPACHLVPSSISPRVSELQFPKHSRNPFSPLLLCFLTKLCSFSDAWCFIEHPAEWRDSINICREDERMRTRRSAAVSAALGWTLGLPSSIFYQEDLYFGLSQSCFSCLWKKWVESIQQKHPLCQKTVYATKKY